MKIEDYLIKSVKKHTSTIDSIKFWKNKYITGSNDKTIKFFDKKNLKDIKIIYWEESVWALEIIYKYLVAGLRNGKIIFFNMEEDFKMFKTWDYIKEKIFSFVAYKNHLIVGTKIDIKVIDIQNFKVIKTLKDNTYNIHSLIIYNKFLISGSKEGSINFYDLNNEYEKLMTIYNKNSIFRIFNYNEYLIVYEYWNKNKIKIYNLEKSFSKVKISIDWFKEGFSYYIRNNKILIGNKSGLFNIFKLSIFSELNKTDKSNNNNELSKNIKKLEKVTKKQQVKINLLESYLLQTNTNYNMLIKKLDSFTLNQNNNNKKNDQQLSENTNKLQLIESKYNNLLEKLNSNKDMNNLNTENYDPIIDKNIFSKEDFLKSKINTIMNVSKNLEAYFDKKDNNS